MILFKKVLFFTMSAVVIFYVWYGILVFSGSVADVIADKYYKVKLNK